MFVTIIIIALAIVVAVGVWFEWDAHTPPRRKQPPRPPRVGDGA